MTIIQTVTNSGGGIGCSTECLKTNHMSLAVGSTRPVDAAKRCCTECQSLFRAWQSGALVFCENQAGKRTPISKHIWYKFPLLTHPANHWRGRTHSCAVN